MSDLPVTREELLDAFLALMEGLEPSTPSDPDMTAAYLQGVALPRARALRSRIGKTWLSVVHVPVCASWQDKPCDCNATRDVDPNSQYRWICAYCTTVNSVKDITCLGCRRAADALGNKRWVCTGCKSVIDIAYTYCIRCGVDKPK